MKAPFIPWKSTATKGQLATRFGLHLTTRYEMQVKSSFPQSDVLGLKRVSLTNTSRGDWLVLGPRELAVVLPLYLERNGFLPLKTVSDPELYDGVVDPLGPALAAIADTNSRPGGGEHRRMGVRVIVQPCDDDWSLAYWADMRQRRDRQAMERNPSIQTRGSSDAQLYGLLGLLAAAGVAFANYKWWNSGDYLYFAGLDLLVVAALAGLGQLYWRYSRKRGPTYFDETAVGQKLNSHAFITEIQLIAITDAMERDVSETKLRGLVNLLRGFNSPSGNRLKAGKPYVFGPGSAKPNWAKRRRWRPADALPQLNWLSFSDAACSQLCTRELATVWHLPIGPHQSVAIDRVVSAGEMVDLNLLKAGAPVGHTMSSGQEIFLSDEILQRHSLLVAKSGMGKTSCLVNILADKLRDKARGEHDGAIVFLDPHGDAVKDLLPQIPSSLLPDVRVLDLGGVDRLPVINVLDAALFPDRNRCVIAIVELLEHLWPGEFQSRMLQVITQTCYAGHEYNSHPDTSADHALTFLDIPGILRGGSLTGRGTSRRYIATDIQNLVLSRVKDPTTLSWFNDEFFAWPDELRREAVTPISNRIDRMAANRRLKIILGTPRSTINLARIVDEGLVLFVNTAEGVAGRDAAALIGKAILGLIYDQILAQGDRPSAQRKSCVVAVDEFQNLHGFDWSGITAESRKFGGRVILVTQSLAALRTGDRNVRSAVLGSCSNLIVFQVAAEDADILQPELGSPTISTSDLVNLDPFSAYLRLNTRDRRLVPFAVRTLPPPLPPENADSVLTAVKKSMEIYTIPWRADQASDESPTDSDSTSDYQARDAVDESTLDAGSHVDEIPTGETETVAETGSPGDISESSDMVQDDEGDPSLTRQRNFRDFQRLFDPDERESVE